MDSFFSRLLEQQKSKKSMLCVGLDPHLEKLPKPFPKEPDSVLPFLKQIVDATLPYASCFKPQVAYFSAFGLESALVDIISYIKQKDEKALVILDAKRNDIGSTAEMYAKEVFERYGADAVTLNPYMGGDSVSPFSSHKDRACFLLCRTSNEGGRELQNLTVGDGEPFYTFVARKALTEWDKNENIGLVVGATAIKELKKIRTQFPEAWFLVPGVGAQGGDLKSVLEYGRRVDGQSGLIVNSARGILYASDGDDFAAKAGEVAAAMHSEMTAFAPH